MSDRRILPVNIAVDPINWNCELKTTVTSTYINAYKPEADPPGYFPGLINKCERHY